MSTIAPPPVIEQLRSALPAGAEHLADQVAARLERLERLERTLRTFAEHGATHGWIPDDAHRWHAGDWFEYLHRLERTVRQRAAAALADDAGMVQNSKAMVAEIMPIMPPRT